MSGSISSGVGLASGIDTDSMIEQLMAIERNPIVRMNERISAINVEKDAYRDINSRLDSLKKKLETLIQGDVFDEVNATSSNTNVMTASASSAATAGTYDLRVQQLAKADSVISAKNATFTFGGASATIQVNGVDVTVHGTELTDLRNAINANDEAGARASIIDGRLVITNEETGVANNMTLTDNDPNNGILEQLGILISDAGDDSTLANDYAGDNTAGGYKTTAQDAVFTIEGLEISRSSNQGIDDVITGVTINLKGTSSFSGAGVFPDDYESTTLTIAPDDDAVVSAVKSFVDQYNSVMSFISKLTAYDSESETAGELQGDFFANNIKNQMLNLIGSQNPEGETTFRSLFGIVDSNGTAVFSTSDPTVGAGGQIEFDETALRNVLGTHRQDVYETFAYDADGDALKESGIGVNMKSYLTDMTRTNTGLIAEQIKSLEGSVDSINDSIERTERLLSVREENLRRQFATMEQLVSRMQSNSSYFGGGSSFLSA